MLIPDWVPKDQVEKPGHPGEGFVIGTVGNCRNRLWDWTGQTVLFPGRHLQGIGQPGWCCYGTSG